MVSDEITTRVRTKIPEIRRKLRCLWAIYRPNPKQLNTEPMAYGRFYSGGPVMLFGLKPMDRARGGGTSM
jgi:hypothetical protein